MNINDMNLAKGSYENRENIQPSVSLYEYYKINDQGGNSPLLIGPEAFILNGKNLTILSGAIHYFRVHPKYWRDRLRKLRAMGANTVETYVPWNLHEPEKDQYDFGKEVSGTDYPFSEWLDVIKFIKMAKEEDLFVIVRPGPYICSEWDFGGLPSYLLKDPDIKLRTNDPRYTERVDKYFNQLLPRFTVLQVEHGGPILMFQIENEYGYIGGIFGNEHLKYLKKKMQEASINGLFVTSDGILLSGRKGSLNDDDVLMTANFQDRGNEELSALKEIQPSKAAMVMEFWTGWFDHWGSPHETRHFEGYAEKLNDILRFPASVNLYMFHGGTNFGFMNGANQWNRSDRIDYEPDTTSYDYDAVLTENGDYTSKYYLTRQLFMRKQKPLGIKTPDPPEFVKPVAYQPISLVQQLRWDLIVGNINKEDQVESNVLMPMESLPLQSRKGSGERGGQCFGFILYRINCDTTKNPIVQIKGRVRDMVTVIVDGSRKTDVFSDVQQIRDFGFWGAVDAYKTLDVDAGSHVFDILVENMGRNNFGFDLKDFDQRKGLFEGTLFLNDKELNGLWSIMALDFQPDWITGLEGWVSHDEVIGELESPTMFKAFLDVKEVFDTYIDMRGWGKGVVFVNGFNIGRYLSVGPQLALYIPGPLLKHGRNEIIVFELYKSPNEINFSAEIIYT